MWLLPVVGFLSLLWFLVRVVPKPSRAAYPCQQVAAPLAGGFIVWLTGLLTATLSYRKAAWLFRRRRYAAAAAVLVLTVGVIWLSQGTTIDALAQRRGFGPAESPFVPSEQANQPIGMGQGIHAGRVVWVRDPQATSWDGTSGDWWDDTSTDQAVVNDMMSRTLRSLVGCQTEEETWDALFKHFNRTRGAGDVGYKPGEKIAIKINANQDRSDQWAQGRGMPSPHVVYALLDQLIGPAGVAGEDITVYDATERRSIGDPIFKRVRANPDQDFQAVTFVVGIQPTPQGRVAPTVDRSHPVKFARSDLGQAYLPTCVTESKYLINLALLRAHGMCGVTLTAKNHYGSVYFENVRTWVPRPLHGTSSANNPMGSYNNLVDLMGHEQLGGKTLFYMLDGLYTAIHNEGNVFRFASLGGDWASSLLASQDPVAIDSVGLDILRNEPRATSVRGNVDNYLHEAALAGSPPSGTRYDPEGNGTPLTSLGVHEHWNNSTEKKYSRNLGTGDGIELLMPEQ